MSGNKLKKCFDEGARGSERHQGLRRAATGEAEVRAHLMKAMHNFRAMGDFHELHYSDWSASAAFYTLYHALFGYSGRARF